MILELGFYQTTLTNFERQEFRGRDRRFMYEELSFRPDRYDMMGFGPTGISFADSGLSAVKVINPGRSVEYNLAVDRGRPAWDRAFGYGSRDLRVFHLTRRLAALKIGRLDYQRFFGSDPIDDFPREFEALEGEGWCMCRPNRSSQLCWVCFTRTRSHPSSPGGSLRLGAIVKPRSRGHSPVCEATTTRPATCEQEEKRRD